jgi:hypothetical protein
VLRFFERLNRPKPVLLMLAIVVAINACLYFFVYQARLQEPSGDRSSAQSAAPGEPTRRELELRRGGHLAKPLGAPLPKEAAATLERFAREDEERAEQGLVQLRRGDRVWWKEAHRRAERRRPHGQGRGRRGADELANGQSVPNNPDLGRTLVAIHPTS